MNKRALLWGGGLWLLLVAFIVVMPYLPISSNQSVAAPFLLPEDSKKAVVFFGFSACTDVCPMTLQTLKKTLQGVHESLWPQVIFIDIAQSSNAVAASLYAKQFHPRFKGFFPTVVELSRLKQDFGLNLQQVGKNISHKGRAYMLEYKRGRWWLIKTINPQGDLASVVKAAWL